MNVRFWIYNKGWVKLTLEPNQELVHKSYTLHEEGYSNQIESYFYSEDEKQVISEMIEYGSDCDGPYESYRSFYCWNTSLKAIPGEVVCREELPDRPEWKKLGGNQRDYYAESMGY